MNKLVHMQVFCRIVELGTFAAVAREMNLSAMMISKYVYQLEKSLSITLLNRTTRSIALTEAGQFYYQRSKQLIEDFNDLQESTANMADSVKGTLKVNAPIDFGGLYMIEAIEAYQQQYPEVNIMMSLNNDAVNLRKDDCDISILVTDTLDQGVVAKRINHTELCTYASPEYIALNGLPETPAELDLHRCLYYLNTPHKEHWIFNTPSGIERVKHNWSFASNNGRALCQAAALGMGIVQAPKLTVSQYLETGQLVEILADYKIHDLFVYATYLQRQFYPAKLTTFIEFITSFFNHNR